MPAGRALKQWLVLIGTILGAAAQSAGPAAFASLLAAGAAIAAAEGELTRAAELLGMADALQRACGVLPAARQVMLEQLQAPIARELGAEAFTAAAARGRARAADRLSADVTLLSLLSETQTYRQTNRNPDNHPA